MIPRIVGAFFLASLLLASCGRETPMEVRLSKEAVSDMDVLPSSAVIPPPTLTRQELSRLETIRTEGGLVAGTILWPGLFEQDDEGTYQGFHYDLVEAVSAVLDIEVTYHLAESLEFFPRDGLVSESPESENEPVFIPDIFTDVHFLVFDLDSLFWRERRMEIVPVLPSRKMVITRDEEPIVQLGDLAGKTGIVYEGTTYAETVQKLNANLNLGIELRSLPPSDNDIRALLSGRGDFCLRGSSFMLSEFRDYSGLDISMTVGTASENGWAFPPDDPLSSAFERALEYLRQNGTLEKLFFSRYGVELEDYYSLIHYNPDTRLELNDEEMAYLENLRETDGLKVAIYDEQSIYEVDSRGHISGLHYNLLLSIAALLDLELSLEPVDFSEFFRKDGFVDDRLKTDPDFSYRPDLFDRADLYAVTMTWLPWREKFLRYIDIYPTRMVYIFRNGESIPRQNNMRGRTISLLADSSYETWARENLPLDDMEVLSGSMGLDQTRRVAEEMSDFSLLDANLALTRLPEFPNLTFYPTDRPVDRLGWAVSEENEILGGIMDKSLDYLRSEHSFEIIWKAYYGISFDEYLRLLSIEERVAK